MTHEELRRLYPNFSDEKLQEAKENLDRYLLLAWEISEEEQAALTNDAQDSRMKAKVDSPQIN